MTRILSVADLLETPPYIYAISIYKYRLLVYIGWYKQKIIAEDPLDVSSNLYYCNVMTLMAIPDPTSMSSASPSDPYASSVNQVWQSHATNAIPVATSQPSQSSAVIIIPRQSIDSPGPSTSRKTVLTESASTSTAPPRKRQRTTNLDKVQVAKTLRLHDVMNHAASPAVMARAITIDLCVFTVTYKL
jgi:hypothetical protein